MKKVPFPSCAREAWRHEENPRKIFVGQRLGVTPKSWLTPKRWLLIGNFVVCVLFSTWAAHVHDTKFFLKFFYASLKNLKSSTRGSQMIFFYNFVLPVHKYGMKFMQLIVSNSWKIELNFFRNVYENLLLFLQTNRMQCRTHTKAPTLFSNFKMRILKFSRKFCLMHMKGSCGKTIQKQ